MSTFNVRDKYELYIGGKEVPGTAEPLTIINPATGETIASCAAASPADVEQAISVAQETFNLGVWSKLAPADRSRILEDVARKFAEAVPQLAVLESMQTGRPLREMKIQLSRLPEWFSYFAALARTEEGSVQPTRGSLLNYVKRGPLGVCALITSFNHPLLISVKKLAPALAAGNSVIIKPSEMAPLTVIELGRITKEAGLPDGVLSILPGYGAVTGKAIVEDPRIKKVDLTGGTQGGRVVGSIVGRNLAHYTAELGGKAPVIVFENVDLELAVNGVAFGAFIASGQTCVAATRIIVHKNVFEEFMAGLTRKVTSITERMGSPTHEDSMMGAIISAKQLSIVETLVDSAREDGATIVAGGKRMTGKSPLDGTDLSKGFFYPPTLITDGPSKKVVDTRIWKEEAFGPVLAIVTFETEAEAIQLANDSEYGLGSAIWCRDGGQAIRVADQLDVGLVWINTHHRNDPSSAWGGTKASGVGRENGVEAYHAYSQTKSVIYNYAPDDECRVSDNWFREGNAVVRYG